MAESAAEFVEIGDDIVRRLREVAGLGPESRVVDIGCGYGRLAHALLRWPGFRGRYAGIDILERHVGWCAECLAPLAGGRFEFRFLDVRNGRYNPQGALDPNTVDLGVPPRSADVVVLSSVFTHMYPEQITHYLEQIRLMAAPGARVFATFFLLNDAWRAAAAENRPRYPLPHALNDVCRFMDAADPLHVIAYEESWVRQQVAAAAFGPVGSVLYGSWSGRADAFDFQDVLVFGPPA